MCADLRSVTINPFRNRLPGFFGAAALGLLIFAHYGIDDLTLQDWATPQNGRTTPATASAGSAVPTATLTATTLATTSRYVSGNPIAPALPGAFTAPGQRPNPTPPGAASFGGTSTVPPLIVRSPAASGLAARINKDPALRTKAQRMRQRYSKQISNMSAADMQRALKRAKSILGRSGPGR
jgi:hypothetical protein